MKKESIKYYLHKLLSVLRVRSKIIGLEISDVVLRSAIFDGRNWKVAGVRIEPGIIESGKIKDYSRFVESLKSLRSKSLGNDKFRRRINVIASLSSISVYSQVFSLPIIEGENLEKAVQLNIQMVAPPMEVSQTYSGWQLVGQNQDALRLDVLSSFIDRSAVDEFTRALFDAGFLMVVLESRSLSMARLFKEMGSGIDINKSYVLIAIDNSGIDFMIIKRGQLYFEYFNPWKDVMDDTGQITVPAFEAEVLRGLRQVVNFYVQHWSEDITGVVISAIALETETARVIADNFSFSVSSLKLSANQDIGPEWFTALGCGLRGLKPRGEDKEMSLLGIGAEEEFRREQLLSFTNFWRIAMPLALGMLLVIFLLGDLFLIGTKNALESDASLGFAGKRAEESQNLQLEAADFNKSVAIVKSVRSSLVSKGLFLEKILAISLKNRLTISSISFPSSGQQITLAGKAQSEENILNFRKDMGSDKNLSNIVLPLTGIQTNGNGVVFSMNFNFNP